MTESATECAAGCSASSAPIHSSDAKHPVLRGAKSTWPPTLPNLSGSFSCRAHILVADAVLSLVGDARTVDPAVDVALVGATRLVFQNHSLLVRSIPLVPIEVLCLPPILS